MKYYRIFLCGDVMTGRGIDQILPLPCKPQLYESFVTDARDYVSLAENVNGKIHYPVSMDYIWGDALAIWEHYKPDVKIINLETSITQHEDYWRDKGIHYRMNPLNIDVLKKAKITMCSVANNHIIDWGFEGLSDTLLTLNQHSIQYSGAGENSQQAMQPVIVNLDANKRVLLFSAGTDSSGIPSIWKATPQHAGVYFLPDLSDTTLSSFIQNIKHYRMNDDLIIVSLHWGSNWGYDISESFRYFAHGLIDSAMVDVVYGHSSHHPRPIEIYQGKPIFYGCGDFINDYEGIKGYENYRSDLVLMYFIDFAQTSFKLLKMTLIPLQISNFRLHRANRNDCEWLRNALNQSATFSAPLILKNNMLIYIQPNV